VKFESNIIIVYCFGDYYCVLIGICWKIIKMKKIYKMVEFSNLCMIQVTKFRNLKVQQFKNPFFLTVWFRNSRIWIIFKRGTIEWWSKFYKETLIVVCEDYTRKQLEILVFGTVRFKGILCHSRAPFPFQLLTFLIPIFFQLLLPNFVWSHKKGEIIVYFKLI